MSNAVSALPGAAHAGIASVTEMGLQGMVTLRGDHAEIAAAVKKVAKQDLPGQRRINGGLGKGVAWMSPDELLILCAYEDAASIVEKLDKELKDAHHLAANVSDARAVFAVEGPAAREVIAKLCPVDMAVFEDGEIRRTRMAQVPAAFWMAGPDTIHVVCFRSVARYVFDLLATSAAEGSGPGFF
ncbi:sarcosine oxidase subunit gamma [Rhodobacterales bacterium HKCCE3408]|nr:sarcosine oxidase subunit gamma [Rhodobacterales bacterium HKCCE3408]